MDTLPPSKEMFQALFKLLGKRVSVCQSHSPGDKPIVLNRAIVTQYETTEIENYYRVHFKDPSEVPISINDIDIKSAIYHNNPITVTLENKGSVMVFIRWWQGETMEFTFANSLDHTIVQFQPCITDQDYIKFKLEFT